ncbi:winged helix-turn-helix domain-containing protein [Bryobacter aggregatus]|uniref:winged helix-turn-helix domain-containing protein n=1 Tax=Bryobacter aggregatus TaxID=360054 RepID=UPI0004E0E611|nr:helix-turn-helix domain-containing protein [Bryobacter aggregatus]
MSGTGLQILRDPEAAAVLLDPKRQMLLAVLQRNQNTATGLGKILDMPRQRVNYHLHELERAGLVVQVETRKKGNVVERLVRSLATHYLVSSEAFGVMGADRALPRGRFSFSSLITAASRMIRDIGLLALRAAKAEKQTNTFTMETEIRFRNEEERSAFAAEMAAFVATQAAKYHDEKAEVFRLTVALYPKIAKDDEDDRKAVIHITE